ncbi:dTDP-4-amino-4,6-dideoxygalactose transaminase [Synechococcus sp. LTW-R]|uniref:dTDP-4-amino-4,6-dideoxygalactose transaminase n=1 Tax=Synechococcus sp. LTW-R TaxID=2751170 RepID=UPI00162964BF|nr:dTDP-4-amino-4,6-dideoxygalactose transaminase [Synechococcus sp. LTW-R]QNG28911.1 dTDP-4-amino-4,6-dideoxygalactose transaminase [Synechococcus sp. LTW-R]
MSAKEVPFNKPYLTGDEIRFIQDAHHRGQLSGDGYYTGLCSQWIKNNLNCGKVLLTHSCTAALEMSALLGNLSEGDEVIMPSYTFVSTANAFVLRGIRPIFVDIRPDTLNIDETKIEAAITSKTKAIVVVHYAGVACELDAIIAIAQRHELLLVEDAAQAFLSKYKDEYLGTFGNLATFSFHETKNIISGEGGALIINEKELFVRSEIIREKGTNRSQFFRGEIDKYNWVDLGSSFLPGEIVSAFLWGQLKSAFKITSTRIEYWNEYHLAFSSYEAKGILTRPWVPSHCTHNAHMYYLIFEKPDVRSFFIKEMKDRGIHCVFHYVPLHNSPFVKGKFPEVQSLPVTERVSDCLVRLPMWIGMDQSLILKHAKEVLNCI